MFSLLFIYLALNLITGDQLDDDKALVKSLMAIGFQVIVLLVLLNWRKHPERFAQTLSALALVGIVFNLVMWVLLSQSDPEDYQVFGALLLWGVFFWSLFVDANIYRHALGVTLSIGMLISVLALASSFALLGLFFPQPVAS